MNADILRAFLDDCKAAPDDDTPRLILADWLQEHGATEADRARGEFIRLQVCLSHLDLADENPAERSDRARAWGLLRCHRADWIGDLEAAGLGGVRFVRGLVEADCRSNRLNPALLDRLGMTTDWQWVEHLRVLGGHFQPGFPVPADWLLGVPDGSSLEAITALSIESQTFYATHALALGAWPGLGRLHTLNLSSMVTSDEDLPLALGTTRPSNLRRLQLDIGNATGRLVREVMGDCDFDHLEHLHLSWDGPGSDEVLDMLTAAPFRTRLRSLGFGDGSVDPAGLERLAWIDLPALRHLRLVECGMTPGSATTLADSTWFSQLEAVELGEDAIEPLLRLLGSLGRLRALTITGDLGPGEPLSEVASFDGLPALRALAITYAGLGGTDLERFRDSWRLPQPRVLDLRGNYFGDAAARMLAFWPGLSRLHRLDLRENSVGEDGLRRLVESPYLPPWAEIDLRDNYLSDFRDVAAFGLPIRV